MENEVMSLGTVKERIVRVANELKITKEGKNTFAHYEYIKPEDLQNALKPLYLKYRLFAHFGMRKLDNNKNEAILRIEDWDTDVGRQIYTMVVDNIELKGANSVQSVGGMRTYCNRYLLMTAFNIASDKDDLDSNRVITKDLGAKVNKTSSQVQSIISQIDKIAQELGAIKGKDTVVEIIKKHHRTANYRTIADIELAQELLNELTDELSKTKES